MRRRGCLFTESGFRVGFRVGFSSFTQRTLSAVLHIVLRSFQDGGERGWQIGIGNFI